MKIPVSRIHEHQAVFKGKRYDMGIDVFFEKKFIKGCFSLNKEIGYVKKGIYDTGINSVSRTQFVGIISNG